MKKTYEKPEILFEDFSLSSNIAGDCEKIVGNPSKGQCAVKGTGGMDMFLDSVSLCVVTQSDDDYDGYCYHVPTEYNNLFNS